MTIDVHFRKVQLGDVATVRRIRNLLIKLNEDRLEDEEQNIWLMVWKDKYGIKKQYKSKIAELFRDYLFTVLPYIVAVISLIYLIFR
jgi:hypothetical protein